MPEIYSNTPYQDWIFHPTQGIKRLHQSMFVEGVTTECDSGDADHDGTPDGLTWQANCVLDGPYRVWTQPGLGDYVEWHA